MRNYVAKNDFNRAATHKSALDYSRVNSRELMDSCYGVGIKFTGKANKPRSHKRKVTKGAK